MEKQKRIADYNIRIGKLPKGKLNKITDVKGIKVGHCTIDNEDNKTGVTVILPSENNIFPNKYIAASYVLNGFGKTQGLIQIDELGTLESPIALTNTLNVGIVNDAIVDYMLEICNRDSVDMESLNPVICECNDRYLNNIRKKAVKKEHVFNAINNCSIDFEEGDVGGGKGMSCHELKGGIGSASRIIELDGKKFTLGVLVQSNHGLLEDLCVNGKRVGEELAKKIDVLKVADRGSIIMIIATDVPLESRQLKRICKRASVGLCRLGSFVDHGSGEVAIAFSTANIIDHNELKDKISVEIINENKIDVMFRATAECVEEAVLNSMVTANSIIGYNGHIRESLKDYILDI